MADGDSASPYIVEEKQCRGHKPWDAAVEQDFNSISLSKVAEGNTKKEIGSAEALPALHAMDTGDNLDSSTNDLTKFCKDTTNTIIHSIVNGMSEAESAENGASNLSCSNPLMIGVEKSPGANLSSLSQLCVYDSDSDHSVSELSSPLQSENLVELRNNYNYRSSQAVLSDSEDDSEEDSDEYPDDSSSTTSSSSGSSSSSTAVASSDDSDSDSDEALIPPQKPDIIRNEEPKTKGELSINDLPPIEDLHISVPEQECLELGHIESIVDTLVVVQAKKNSPALDLDSILFLDQGKRPLGRVFDVFGPVNEPCYCVRFNSADHIHEKQVVKGMAVYCAPRSEFSSYVFMPDLLRMKGSDASWEYNNEPPRKFLDYSDDEEERRARKADKGTNKEFKGDDADQPSRKRRTKYEQLMNSRNLRMSAINPPVSSHNPWGSSWVPQLGSSMFSSPPPTTPPLGASSPLLIRPPSFSVPPPPPPAMFSSPPPPFPAPPGAQLHLAVKERPLVPDFNPTLPPPPIQSPSPRAGPVQFNVPPPTLPRTSEKLPSNLFHIPPPPPLPSISSPMLPSPLATSAMLPSPLDSPPVLPSPLRLSQLAFLSSPPPQPPPAHW